MEVSVDSSEQIARFLEKFDRFRRDFERHEEDELTLILDSIDDERSLPAFTRWAEFCDVKDPDC